MRWAPLFNIMDLFSAEDVHMFGFKLRREGEDLFGAFGRLVDLLDEANFDVAFASRQVLVDVVCEELSSKEMLLACADAFSKNRGFESVCFLLQTARDALEKSSLGPREASSLLWTGARAVAACASTLREEEEEKKKEMLENTLALLQTALRLDAEQSLESALQMVDQHEDLFAQMWTPILSEEIGRSLLERGSHDGRVALLLAAVLERGGQRAPLLLRPCVFAPAHSLRLSTPAICAAVRELCQDEKDSLALKRARRAVFGVGAQLIGRQSVELSHWHQWGVKSLLLALVDFSVRSPEQAERLKGWNLIELLLEKMSNECRTEALAHLLQHCPFTTVVALVIGKVKSAYLAGDADCDQLLSLVFRLPKDASELSAQQEAIVAALNFLLLLAIRKSDRVAHLRQEYLLPLERLLAARIAQAKLPMDLEQQNKLMKTVSEHQWTEETLREAQKKTQVTDELCMSIIRRIEEYI